MSELVTIDLHEGVADVRLNRPEKINALSPAMFSAISEAGASLLDNRAVRAIVLSGNGRGFCAGLDFSSFDRMAGDDDADADTASSAAQSPADVPENHAQRPAYIWKRQPVPVIAALHGVALGGGLQVALGADIRIAAPDARLSVMEIKWGLIPDMSLTQTLRDLVPLDVAKELVFSGRVLSGDEACALGLVTRISAHPLDDALTLAAEIANRSPDAIRSGKRLLEQTWHADETTGLRMEASLQQALIGSPNQIEAVKANFEERRPRFADPA